MHLAMRRTSKDVIGSLVEQLEGAQLSVVLAHPSFLVNACARRRTRREFITVRRIPLSSLLQQVEAWAAAGFQVDARLYAFAVGHGLGTELGGLDAPASRGRGGRKLCLRRIACYAVHAGVVAAALLAGRWMGRRSVR